MTDCYPYRVLTRTGHLALIWRPGEGDDPDTFAVDGAGALLVFHDPQTLRTYCERKRWELIRDGAAELDPAAVRQWVGRPEVCPVPSGFLLDAWNFFEDLAWSLTSGPSLAPQGPVHDSAYEKFFGGDVPGPADDGAWTDEEAAAVRDFLTTGLELWEHAVRGAAAR
ncbi:hypothetical protein [Streptomyces sp. ALB3]|uniref:hypothetical protein n=1 Tax=Streptomyces sp. ALB3 TaxID=3374278 RepID=UPI00379A99F3